MRAGVLLCAGVVAAVVASAARVRVGVDGKSSTARAGIERRSGLSVEEWLREYDEPGVPVLVTDVVGEWPAFRALSKAALDKSHGERQVVMKAMDRGQAETLTVPLGLFAQHAQEGSNHTWAYVLDETFLVVNEELGKQIHTAPYLEDDWFKLLPPELRPWDRMLLWGSPASRSTLHIDPYNWTGTNAVFSGTKHWKLIPPGQDHLLPHMYTGSSGFPLETTKYHSGVDLFDPSTFERFPHLRELDVWEFAQRPGEFLIIPSGWWHQAYNSEETIAVSSQVMNRNNFAAVMEEMRKGGGVRFEPDELAGPSPREWVQDVFSRIPQYIRRQGREVFEDVRRQTERGASLPGGDNEQQGAKGKRRGKKGKKSAQEP